jgi:hypothetical protein
MKFSNKYKADNFKNIIYNPDTGFFSKKTGDSLREYIDHRGYRKFDIYGLGPIIAHRAAWAITYGFCPDMHIDHIDGDKLNNKITNLRLCTHNQNQHNQGIRVNNKSGFKGVSWMKSTRKWQAQICFRSKVKHLGLFNNKIDAAKAYDMAAIDLHGEFAWLNFPHAKNN